MLDSSEGRPDGERGGKSGRERPGDNETERERDGGRPLQELVVGFSPRSSCSIQPDHQSYLMEVNELMVNVVSRMRVDDNVEEELNTILNSK